MEDYCPGLISPMELKDRIRIGIATWKLKGNLYFVVPNKLEIFLQDYRQILIYNFQTVRIQGTREYWTCGQNRDPRNWNWKPWQHLERQCRKMGLDDFAVRGILFEHLGRKLDCECQVLYDERELRKEALKRQFGVDFESGEVGLAD
jgi:hypothetical protein